MPSEVGSESGYENAKAISVINGGDRKAVELLFASNMRQLRRAAAWMFPNSDEVEDAVQDGLLLAYRNLNQFQGRAQFSTWLHKIVINASLGRLRRQRSRPTTSIDQEASSEETSCIADMLIDPRPNPEQKYIKDERSRILAEMLEDLPTTSRMVIQLMDIEGLSGREAAQKLGISSSALKARHHRARQLILQKMLEPHERMSAESISPFFDSRPASSCAKSSV
jgi:RNA polymerase sigma-70 factor (ECF subfamily)